VVGVHYSVCGVTKRKNVWLAGSPHQTANLNSVKEHSLQLIEATDKQRSDGEIVSSRPIGAALSLPSLDPGAVEATVETGGVRITEEQRPRAKGIRRESGPKFSRFPANAVSRRLWN
jgi:hypothetical protein